MHKLEVKDGKVYLDGKHIECVKEYEIKSSAKENYAELSLKLRVKLSKIDCSHCEE